MPFDVIDQEGRSFFDGEELTIRAFIMYNAFDPSDRTVADIVWEKDRTLEEYMAGLPPENTWVLFAKGDIQPREKWASITLEPNDQVVLTLQPDGPLLILAPFIADAIVAVAGIGFDSAAVLASVVIASQILSVAVVLGAGYLLTSLLSAPKPTAAQQGSSYSITGPFNTSSEGVCVPVVYGAFRMAGNLVNEYVANGNNVTSQFLFMMFVVGEGPVYSIQDLQINYNPIENFARASWDWRSGTVGQAPMMWFSENITPINQAQHLTTTAYVYTTSQPVDRFQLDFQFPNGLYSVDSAGNLGTAVCNVDCSYQQVLDDGSLGPSVSMWAGPTWFLTEVTQPYPLTLPNVYNTNGYASGLRMVIDVVGDSLGPQTAYSFNVQYRTSDIVPPSSSVICSGYPPVPWRIGGSGDSLVQGPWITFAQAAGNITNNPVVAADGTMTYTPGQIQLVFELNNLTINTFDFYMTNNLSTGIAVVSMVEIYTAVNHHFETSYRGTWNINLPSPTLQRAVYQISVRRDINESTANNLEDAVWLEDIDEINDDVVNYNNTAYYGLQIVLGGALTSEPTVTAMVLGRMVTIYDRGGNILSNPFWVPIDYNGGLYAPSVATLPPCVAGTWVTLENTQQQYFGVASTGATAWSANPADIALDLLLNPRQRFGILASRIDFPAFDNWRQYCVANNLYFNGSFDSQTNVWDAVVQVMRIGHAGPAMVGLRWSVVIEGPCEATQLFTQDNMITGTFQNQFIGRKNRANQVEVVYWDENDFYKQHSAFAFDPTMHANDALVVASIQGIGINNFYQAQNEAWFQLYMNMYITQACKFDVFLQALGASVGDVVVVQHNMPAWGYAAKVKSVNYNSTTGTGTVVIDSPLPAGAVGTSGWNMLLMQSARVFACSTIHTVSGYQITCTAFTNPVAPTGADPTLLIEPPMGGISNWENEIGSPNGMSRVLILNSGVLTDYGVNDQQVITVSGVPTLFLTLDQVVAGSVGAAVYLVTNDGLLQATLANPVAQTDAFDQTLTITGWTTDQGSPQPQDRILLGQSTTYQKQMRVTNITMKNDHVRTVSCSEYNPSIYTGYPTPPVNSSTLPVTMVQVNNLAVQQGMTVLPGGALQYYADVTWNQPLNSPFGYGGATVYVEINNGVLVPASGGTTSGGVSGTVANGVVTAPNTNIQIPLNEGDTAIIKVVSFGTGNQVADNSAAPVCVITIGQSTTLPTPIPLSSFIAVGGIRQIALSWELPSDPFIATVELWESPDDNPADAYLIYSGLTNYFVRAGLNPDETMWYYIRTVSIAGTYSPFIGPVSATTSLLLAADLAAGIIGTAAFAAGLAPVALWSSGTLPTSLGATGGVQVIYNETDGQLYRWNGTAFTAAVPAVNVTGQLTQAQIAALAIGPAQLAAGAVTTASLAVGNPTNVIWNGCCGQVTDGWSVGYASGYGSTGSFFPWGAGYAPPGYGAGYAVIASTVTTIGSAITIGWQNPTSGVAVTAGQLFGAGAIVIASVGTTVVPIISWYDTSGTFISLTSGTAFTGVTVGAGNMLTSYAPISVIGLAPVNACSAVFTMQLNVVASSVSNPTLIFTQAQFGQLPPNATALSPWAPGGVTNVSGGCLTAGSVNALQIAANSITTGKIAANAVTAGTIAAGAVNAAQIAAGAVNAVNLASTFALIDYEQVGLLNVNDLNLIGDAVTSYASVSNTGSGTGDNSWHAICTLSAVNVPVGADGTARTRTGVCFINIDQGDPHGGSPVYSFSVYQDGANIYERDNLAQYVDFVSVAIPVQIYSGSVNQFVLNWKGNTSIQHGSSTITVLGRIA